MSRLPRLTFFCVCSGEGVVRGVVVALAVKLILQMTPKAAACVQQEIVTGSIPCQAKCLFRLRCLINVPAYLWGAGEGMPPVCCLEASWQQYTSLITACTKLHDTMRPLNAQQHHLGCFHYGIDSLDSHQHEGV